MAMISSAAAWEIVERELITTSILDSDLEIIKSDLKDVRGVFKKGSAFMALVAKKRTESLLHLMLKINWLFRRWRKKGNSWKVWVMWKSWCYYWRNVNFTLFLLTLTQIQALQELFSKLFQGNIFGIKH